MTNRRVAVLGTGVMGAPMARNLLRAGFEVSVWNRTPGRAQPLAGDGARVCGSPAEAVTGADVVLTMLTDGAAVEQAMEQAAEPAMEQAAPSGDASSPFARGAVWLQMSTVGIAATQRLAQLAERLGVTFVDAPVSGSREPAEKGQLLVLASGPDDARPVADPVFDAVGRATVWLGPAGNGTRFKLVVNGWVLALTTGVAEALQLSQGLGLDPRLFLDTVRDGPMDSPYAQMKGAAMLAGDFTTNFSVANAAKDAGLVVEAGRQAGLRLAVAAAAHQQLQRAAERGHAGEDMAAAYLGVPETP